MSTIHTASQSQRPQSTSAPSAVPASRETQTTDENDVQVKSKSEQTVSGVGVAISKSVAEPEHEPRQAADGDTNLPERADSPSKASQAMADLLADAMRADSKRGLPSAMRADSKSKTSLAGG